MYLCAHTPPLHKLTLTSHWTNTHACPCLCMNIRYYTVLNAGTRGCSGHSFSLTNWRSGALGPCEDASWLDIHVRATSAPRLSELTLRCRAETADNLPYLEGGQWRGQYAQMIFPFCRERVVLALGYLVTRRIVYCRDFLDVSPAPQMLRCGFSSVQVMTDGRGNRKQHPWQ